MGDPHWSSLFVKDCTLWKGLMLEQSMEDCPPWEGPHAGAGEEREKEEVAETTCDELTAASIPCPPAQLRGRR